MLKKQFRLRSSKDFDRVFKRGKNVSGRYCYARFLANHLPASRFGFIVSNKTAKKATRRMMLKRRLRESVRHKQAEIKSGYDIVIIAKPIATAAKYRQLDHDVQMIFQKAGLIQ